MTVNFEPLPTSWVRDIQSGGVDVHGQPAERAVSDGRGTPCRHCLREVPEGAEMLILAARPFPSLQPYAEAGPIFLCADPCEAWEGGGVPPVLQTSPDYLIKGYDARDRIVYGTGQITPAGDLAAVAGDLLRDDQIAYIHIRSSRNNCYQCKVTRGGGGHDEQSATRSDP